MNRIKAACWVAVCCLFFGMPAWAEIPVVDGTAYLHIPKDYAVTQGVYRLNEPTADAPVASKSYQLFGLKTFTGKTGGLAVDQKNTIFLLGSNGTAEFKAMTAGSLPEGFVIPTNSALWVTPLLPRSYDRWTHPEGSKAVSNYWKADIDVAGTLFAWVFEPATPPTHRGLPMWDGKTGLRHPRSNDRFMTPSGWGYIPSWAYGTNLSSWAGLALNGENGRTAVSVVDPAWNGTTPDRIGFPPVVKREYRLRLADVGLYKTTDGTIVASPTLDIDSILIGSDLTAWEFFAHAAGNADPAGGAVLPVQIERLPSPVQLLNGGEERRYAFTPAGKKIAPFTGNGAALRLVLSGGAVRDLPLDRTTIRNADSLTDRGIALADITRMAAGARFDRTEADPPDYLFGSTADALAFQESWWGIGGTAYEYDRETGLVTRWDYTQADISVGPRPAGENVGKIPGYVDAMAVDGAGYLYALLTVLEPAGDANDRVVSLVIDAGKPETYRDPHNLIAKVGAWRHIDASGVASDVSTPFEGDVSFVTVRQYITKQLVRYTVNAGGTLGAAEPRGQIEAGYDNLVRRRSFKKGAAVWDGIGWEHEKISSERLASVRGEIAVVQVPQKPQTFNLDVAPPFVCRADGQTLSGVLAEHQTVTFKVEGYKPIVNGDRKGLKDVGICGNLGRTSVNMISGPSGEYMFDEDGDGARSGFPSSLFETDSRQTQITWYADWIEGTGDASPLAHVAVASASKNGFGEYSLSFPQPGNYQVWAKVQYKYFDYSALPEKARTADLPNCVAEITVTTPRKLVQVQSAPNSKSPETWVSNITLLPAPGAYMGVATASTGSGGASKTWDLPEGATPEFLGVQCDVQFVRDGNVRSNTGGALETTAGVGVWNYDTYVDLMGLKLPKRGGRVYNYREASGEDAGLAAQVDTTKYNPGWIKPNDGSRLAENGTRVDIAPDAAGSRDLEYIRWELFVYPTFSKAPEALKAEFSVGGTNARGVSVASGSFAGGSCESIGDRKYRLSKMISSAAFTSSFKTPIDPEAYRLRLEIMYPRVKWSESVAPGEGGVQYRSIVPDNEPVHVVSTAANPRFPSGSSDANENSCFAAGDSWNLHFRDKTELPASAIEPGNLIQTTGDPLPAATMTFVLADNNPMVAFKGFGIKYEMPQYPRDSQSKVWKFVPPSHPEPEPEGPTDTPAFMSNSAFKVTATYAVDVYDYCSGSPFEPASPFENWVGSLSYAVEGAVYDGLGVNGKAGVHSYTWPLPAGTDGQQTIPGQLIRIDNDPPSLHVTLVSQGDNRRWEFALLENVRDLDPVPTSVQRLASCEARVGAFRLDDGAQMGNGTATAQVGGCSDVPMNIGEENRTIELSSLASSSPLIGALLPRVRRSGRLMISLDITDNVEALDLASASIEIIDAASGKNLLPENSPAIPLGAAFKVDGNVNSDLPSPRARYVVDLPMKVDAVQPQVKLVLGAQDAAGNRRSFVIPIILIDAAFDARILESKEQRK
ncbi:MAG: hypothetical protein WA705_02135 [Candidatus Ozemobacteraceae bacterium]